MQGTGRLCSAGNEKPLLVKMAGLTMNLMRCPRWTVSPTATQPVLGSMPICRHGSRVRSRAETEALAYHR